MANSSAFVCIAIDVVDVKSEEKVLHSLQLIQNYQQFLIMHTNDKYNEKKHQVIGLDDQYYYEEKNDYKICGPLINLCYVCDFYVHKLSRDLFSTSRTETSFYFYR